MGSGVCSRLAVAEQQEASQPPAPAGPLTATIHIADAERVARLFMATGGKPTAAQIQKQYLDGASYGVAVFTPYQIMNAGHLATAVATNRENYGRRFEIVCPISSNTILICMRSI